ncbi:peptidoglycan-binding protein LysM [Streptomyces sp. NBC_00249]|uniref:peptidoglycan-binding protein LysM n=1 Tax=Streptomyces sp. NBC_00249 TaxID=2975690 RepID=UPI0022523C89|nr:peptidoglycan-binding protein LysM [Streptomyces sp. NBC_00249]MCX5197234.1 peptidoglycan-binding protein LysM [Streptomyces sp. NBC_00249]
MGEIWIPEAVRLGDGEIGGPMDSPDAEARTVWHTTETGNGATAFRVVAEGLIEDSNEPHILYCPVTDALGQFGPLNESARALRNSGSLRTNRTGEVCIQVEILARAGTPFTGYWRPGPNFRALLRAIRSWGVPDVWPAGRLARAGNDDVSRSTSTWTSAGGHYGHCQIPGNDHWDPGAIDTVALLAAGSGQPPTPGPLSVSLSRLIAAAKADPPKSGTPVSYAGTKTVEAALVAEGLLAASLADGHFGTATVSAFAKWQRRYSERRHLGWTSADCDGIPGKTSLTALGAAHNFTVTA